MGPLKRRTLQNMKRCPHCNRIESDEALKFCRADGTTLVIDSSAIESEAGTVQLGASPNASEVHTNILPNHNQLNVNRATGPTTALPAQPPTNSTSGLNKPKSRHTAIIVAIIVTAAVAAITAIVVDSYRSRTKTKSIQSIAVLPFENKSSDADTDYLSDGLADSLIFRLSQLPELKVSPATSVMRYKGKENDLAKIASELGVEAIMTGRLLKRGDNLNITVELIDTRNNKSLWGEKYERKMSELLTTQNEIAGEITNKLQLKLSGEGEQKLNKRYTDNPEAYQLYLKGRYYWNKRTEENLNKAIEQFKAAVNKDPNFALAYVGLSDCYDVLPNYSNAPSTEFLPQATIYAERAIAIDDSLGEAHISLAYGYAMSWNWAAADKEFKRGLELNPNYATGHHWYGIVLRNLGRYDEALTEFRRAQELEPLSLIINSDLATVLVAKGDLEAAVEQAKRAIELDPNWYNPHQGLANIYISQGRNEEALGEARKAVDLSQRLSAPLSTLGYVLAETGKRSDALQIAEELKARFTKRQAKGTDVGRVYLGLNEKAELFAWLEKDFENRDGTLPLRLGLYPFNSLRNDPLYLDLRKRLNLP